MEEKRTIFYNILADTADTEAKTQGPKCLCVCGLTAFLSLNYNVAQSVAALFAGRDGKKLQFVKLIPCR